jgi:hypothetical protein
MASWCVTASASHGTGARRNSADGTLSAPNNRGQRTYLAVRTGKVLPLAEGHFYGAGPRSRRFRHRADQPNPISAHPTLVAAPRHSWLPAASAPLSECESMAAGSFRSAFRV